MEGFDARRRDLPDCILGITREIWEERGLGPRVRGACAPGVIVRSPGGVETGEPVAARATLATPAEIPDRQLRGEDVTWRGTPEAGMLSSRRIVSTATHAGGAFAPATGARLTHRAIAGRRAEGGAIVGERLERDDGAILRPLALATRLGAARGRGRARPHRHARARVAGPCRGAGASPASGPRATPTSWGASCRPSRA